MQMKSILDSNYQAYATSEFIENDPIAIPHSFSSLQDIEIAGFFSAIFSWGRRDIILKKSKELMNLMGNQPFQFIKTYQPKNYNSIIHFKHRTFNSSDLDFYIRALQKHYTHYHSLEDAFIENIDSSATTIEPMLIRFYDYMTGLVPSENRNLKHIPTPKKKAACKRLCMYLRWMVRSDEIDLGLWKKIAPHQLIIPLDVHVIRIATQLSLLPPNAKANWDTAVYLSNQLKKINNQDPIKYDLALFSMGVNHSINK